MSVQTGIRRTAAIPVAVVLAFVLGTVLSPGGASAGVPDASAPFPLQARGIIAIYGDSELTPANGVVGGNGTSVDPYVISGWDIASGVDVGIRIVGTSSFVLVRDVRVDGLGASLGAGIFLYGLSNVTVSDAVLQDVWEGIAVESAADVLLTRLEITSGSVGVGIRGSGRVTVSDSTFRGAGSGISAYMAQDLRVEGNDIVLRPGYRSGISMRDVRDANVSRNVVVGGWSGIEAFDSMTVTVFSNTVSWASERGIYADSGDLTATWNELRRNRYGMYLYFATIIVHHNRFIYNEMQSFDVGGTPWDAGYPTGGNWWYDYEGVDACSGVAQDVCPDPDGIGDTPYAPSPTGGTVRDRYPLIPTWWPPYARLVPSRTEAFAGEEVTFDASRSTDEDGAIASYTWDLGDGASGTGPLVTHAFSGPGSYVVNLTVVDDDGRADAAFAVLRVVPPVSFVMVEHASGFRLPVPSNWSVERDVPFEGETIQMLATGPTVSGFATNVLVMTDQDASVRESRSYLSAVVDATIEEIRTTSPGAFLAAPNEYGTFGGHAAVTFAITYVGEDVRQKGILIVSDPHDRFWFLILSASSEAYRDTNRTFIAMAEGFEITLPVPGPDLLVLAIAVGAILGGVGGAAGFLVVRSRRKRKAGVPPAAPPGYPAVAPGAPPPAAGVLPAFEACPVCGTRRDLFATFCGRCGARLKPPA